MIAPAVDNPAAVWSSRADELAAWAMARMVNRRDVAGSYLPLRARKERTQQDGTKRIETAVTWPPVRERGKRLLEVDDLARHFTGADVGDLCGLHSASEAGTCLWVAADYDQHGDDPALAAWNRAAAIAAHDKAELQGFDPLLLDSNNRGGFHLIVLFSTPIPVADAYRFARWLVADHAAHGLVRAPECFPKQQKIGGSDGKAFGNWLRLPGRHHTLDNVWTRVYDRDGGFLSGPEAVDVILSKSGDDPAMVAAAIEDVGGAPEPEQPDTATRAQATGSGNGRAKPSGSRRGTDDLSRAIACVEHLAGWRVDNYEAWLNVGLALHDTDQGSASLAAWVAFSRRSTKFVEGECEEKWSGFARGGGITLGSLIEWARADSGFFPPRDDDGNGRSASDGDGVAKMCTDIGNAARLVRRHGRNLRYCHPWGKWLHWNGRRWEKDERGRIVKLAKDVALNIYGEAAAEPDEAKRERIIEHANRSQKRERISAMIDLAKPELAITPDDLDADPWLLNCQNGTVDLRTGQLREHDGRDYLTKICRGSYDPAARCPTFQRVLDRIFRTHPALITFTQRVLGYASTGDTSEQILIFAYGSGANGKTTLIDGVSHALGDYAGKTDRDLLTAQDGAAHPTNVADLMGRRLVVCSETDEGRRFDESKLKDLTGETRLKARFMRQDFFEFQATHKVVLYSNHKPSIRGTDHGIWRRIRLLPFVERISDEEKDTTLGEKLQAEADGILAWLVAGCLAWQRDGLETPAEVVDATDAYRTEMDSIGGFIADCCTLNTYFTATSKDLYAAYCGWCEDNGERPLSQTKLGLRLAEKGLENDRSSVTGRKEWHGIGLNHSGPASDGRKGGYGR